MKEDKYYRAKRIAKAKVQLKGHIISSLAIVVVLVIISIMTSPYYFWAKWPMMGIGISIIFHALAVYKVVYLENYEEKTLKKEMEKLGVDDETDLEEENLDLNDKMELDDLPELRKEWKESDFV